MLNTISHLGNRNSNDNEIQLTSTRIAKNQKTDYTKCWGGCGKTETLILMGMYNGTTIWKTA